MLAGLDDDGGDPQSAHRRVPQEEGVLLGMGTGPELRHEHAALSNLFMQRAARGGCVEGGDAGGDHADRTPTGRDRRFVCGGVYAAGQPGDHREPAGDK